MAGDDQLTEVLLLKARSDRIARQHLLTLHRERLRRAIAARLDRRIASRLDASDIVQEALADADRKLDSYLEERPLPFYAWLFRLACERVIQSHRRHVVAKFRSVAREEPVDPASGNQAGCRHGEGIVADQSTPSQHVARDELRGQVERLLDRLPGNDREILVMHYLEQLTFAEIAACLGIKEGTAKVRHLRALQRVRALREADQNESC